MGGVVRRREHAVRALSCDGKFAYATQASALGAASRIEARARHNRGRRSRLVINAYPCGFCRFWHLTHRR